MSQPRICSTLHTATGKEMGMKRGNCDQEHFWEDESAGRMNKAFVIAALLRCCHAMLRLRCAESLKTETVKALRNPMQLASLVSLVRLCGPFDCSLAAKFLRIMSLALSSALMCLWISH